MDTNNGTDVEFLRYLDCEKVMDDTGLFWMGNQGTGCTTITPLGEIQAAAGGTRLQALCSQSAFLSPPDSTDVGPRWQVAVQIGNATIVGYRDRLSFRFLGLKYAPRPARFGYSNQISGPQRQRYGAGTRRWLCSSRMCGIGSRRRLPPEHLDPVSTCWDPLDKQKGGNALDSWRRPNERLCFRHNLRRANMESRGDVLVVTIKDRLSTLGSLALEKPHQGKPLAVKSDCGLGLGASSCGRLWR